MLLYKITEKEEIKKIKNLEGNARGRLPRRAG